MIRDRIHDFVATWNTHTIRGQKGRPYLIPGQPALLYRGILDKPSPQHVEQNVGWSVDQPLLAELQDLVSSYDLDGFLPEVTLQCCLRYLSEKYPGHHYPIKYTDKHSEIYTKLRQQLRNHEQTRQLPVIQLLPAPVGNMAWIRRVREALGNEIDDVFGDYSGSEDEESDEEY